MAKEETTAIQLQSDFQNQFLSQVDVYLEDRKINSTEFKNTFEKVAADMIYSQTAEGLEAIKKARPLSLFNAIFVATEIGASFAKKEISVLPFAISEKKIEGGVTTKRATGENDLTVVVDINFQKQMILKMPNCKKFFSCEVKSGIEIFTDMETGNCIFEGRGKFSAETIGYYACFISTDGEKYDIFMSCGEIIERAKFNPGFKESNYKNTSKSIHFEKIVVRNLIKIIPREESKLSSIIAYDENYNLEITPHEDVTDKPSVNILEDTKKELADAKKQRAIKIAEGVIETANDIVKDLNNSETINEPSVKSDAQTFF